MTTVLNFQPGRVSYCLWICVQRRAGLESRNLRQATRADSRCQVAAQEIKNIAQADVGAAGGVNASAQTGARHERVVVDAGVGAIGIQADAGGAGTFDDGIVDVSASSFDNDNGFDVVLSRESAAINGDEAVLCQP